MSLVALPDPDRAVVARRDTIVEDLRRLVDRYPGRMTVAEIGSESYVARSIEYTEPGRLHTAYNFLLLENGPLTANLIRSAIESWTSASAWPSWSFSNHDVVRVRTRWGGPAASDAFAQLLLGVLMCLRGTIFLYQGEELGLPQAEVPFDRLRDPEGVRFWPDGLGRDGCRTPMPWKGNAANAGFSSVEPWLPVDQRHGELAAGKQERVRSSTLNLTRAFIQFRREHRVLRLGDIEFLDAPEPVLAFWRSDSSSRLVCVFNLSAESVEYGLPANVRRLDYGLPGALRAGRAALPPWGGLVVEESPRGLER